MPTHPTSGPSSSLPSPQPPDEAMSPALRRRLQVCFERGCQLAKEENFDYAHEMFAECVARDPSNLVYVEAMMDNLQRKYKNNKKGARFRGFGGRGVVKKAAANKEWREVLRLGTELLKTNPWDVPVLRAMANACEGLHFNEVELRYLKNALDANPKDVDVNRHCARSLARMGQFDQAIACWHRIEEARKGDEEAPRMISELTLQKARHSGKIVDVDDLPSETRTRSQPAAAKPLDARENGSSGKQAPEPSQSERQRLEQAIDQDPTNVESYLELAELLAGQGEHADAESVLGRALAASGNDIRVREQLENAQIRHARSQLTVAENQAERQKTESAEQLAKSLRSDLNRLELEIYGARSERRPGDKGLRFELGVRLKRMGNYSEAMKCFEQVQSDPAHKVAATLELGECLQQLRQYSKALDCYVQAARESEAKSERKKLALYRAGVLAAGLKDIKNAEGYLGELLTLDAAYRDARARLDKLRQIQDK